MKKFEFETRKGKFVLVDKESDIFLDLICKYEPINIKDITEEQASEIVDSMQSGFVLGKLVTDLDNHTIEIYAHEGRNVKFISAVKCLHSLLKSKGVHLFDNSISKPQYYELWAKHGDFTQYGKELTNKSRPYLEAEQNTFYNPYIFKL